MTIRYFTTDSAQILAAWAQCRTQRQTLEREGKVFAARFGALPMFFKNPARFAGVVFPNKAPPPPELWRMPDYNGSRNPRRNPRRGASQATKDALTELLAEWDAHVPRQIVDDTPLYEALGFRSSMDFVMGGLTVFVKEGWLYAAADRDMPRLVEILGSQYDQARQSADVERKA